MHLPQLQNHGSPLPLEARGPKGTAADRARGLATKAACRAAWARLPLRQHFADETHLRHQLRTAGIRVAVDYEPATATRMRRLLGRIGLHGEEVRAAVGVDLQRFLNLNPRLPLWAAVALVLEAAGQSKVTRGREDPVKTP